MGKREELSLLRAILSNSYDLRLISNPKTVTTATAQGAIAGYSGLLGAGYPLSGAA